MPRKRTTRSSNSRSASSSRSAKAPPAPKRAAPPAPKRTAPPAIVPQQQKNVAANAQQPNQPSLLGQMASTAAGVAVGSTIGHTLGAGVSSLFGGRNSGSDVAQDQPQTDTPTQQASYYENYQNSSTQSTGVASCEGDAKALTRCLEQNNHNISLCQYYLENLRACQQMASQF